MSKRAIIVFLVGVNLVLLATLILASWRLPAAQAQAVPMASNYLMVAGEIRDGTDALYAFDLERRRMHVFIPNVDQNRRRVVYRGFRDLEQDFRRAP
ncbi:MAG: hypothetical protein ACE5F9_01555 [Phycisphaerae bacterium]